ncbi:MAG: tetratricopeptide repeat protein [Myxococcota bacterium]|nr:tetratricopeptide repeat protein [Myxococcota bacterium]
MDVTCERCGTEYEFDETLVSDRGTTVKCTNCGHLFKVFRPDAEASGAKSWQVRTGDGSTRTLGSLKELQRLITAGSLHESDWISRGGDDWKRLGDIAELSTFFAAAAAATADTDVSEGGPRRRLGTTPGVRAAPVDDARAHAKTLASDATAVDAPIPERKPKSTMIGVGAVSEPPRAPAPPKPPPRAPAPPSSQPPAAAKAPEPRIPAPPRAPSDATAGARPSNRGPSSAPQPSSAPPSAPPSARPARAAAGDRALYLDEEEPATPPRGKSRSGLWVALVVLLAAAVAVALGWPQIAPLLGMAEAPADPANPHMTAGDDALAGDTIDSYEQAIHHYTQALAFDEHDAAVLTRLARAHALWAQALTFDADDLAARAEDDPTRLGEANAKREEARRHAETALQRAEDAVRHGSGDAAAEVALADALRLTGDLERAGSRMSRALTLQSEPSAETLRVRASIEAARAGDIASARPLAEEAVAEDPGMIRARLLYARALLASNEVSAARQQVDRILQRSGGHGRADALRRAIEEGVPPAPPTVDVPEGEGDGETEEAAPEEGDDEPAATPTRGGERGGEAREDRGGDRRGGGSESGAIPSGRDYSWYIRNGDERLERGDVERAQGYYEAARSVRPGGSEALTGLGYIALERGNASQAASQFRQAAGQGYAEAYIGLGSAYRRLGRNADALTAYERYLERLPSGPRASIARRQVEELRRATGGGAETPEPAPEPEPEPETEPAPQTPEGALPPPRDMEGPPPEDVPAIGSEP